DNLPAHFSADALLLCISRTLASDPAESALTSPCRGRVLVAAVVGRSGSRCARHPNRPTTVATLTHAAATGFWSGQGTTARRAGEADYRLLVGKPLSLVVPVLRGVAGGCQFCFVFQELAQVAVGTRCFHPRSLPMQRRHAVVQQIKIL